MSTPIRLVTHQPMKELWRDDGFRTAQRQASLSTDEVTSLLRVIPVQFVVSNIGGPLEWIPSERCFDFWKREVKPHFTEPSVRVRLEDFPGEYCYLASRWEGIRCQSSYWRNNTSRVQFLSKQRLGKDCQTL